MAIRILNEEEIIALEKEQVRLIDELTGKDLEFINKINRVLTINKMLLTRTTTA
jgi:hypothetical protein